MFLRRRRLLASLPGFALLACRRDATAPSEPTGPRRLILANVHTNDPSRPHAEALLLHGPEIVAVGTRAQLERETVDVRHDWRETTIVPGLTDAHAHLLGLGQSREVIDLRGATSVDEILARLRASAPPSGWILGRGWDQNLWAGDGAGVSAMPSAAQLDAAFPDRPVWLRRIDGHAGWGNSQVMNMTGIGASTPNPEGGEILRDPSSNAATGVLIDNAMAMVPVPEPSASDVERWLLAATREAATLGLTGVHEMGLGADAHAIFTRLAREHALPIRVHGYADESWWLSGLDGLAARAISPADRYVLAGVKLYVDGALGSRGAALAQPYSDRPDHRGALMHDTAYFAALVTAILDRGLQAASHAIGDLGNRTIIDAYAQALAATREQSRPDPRLRIEHVQIIDPVDIPRMAALGLVASMQPTHATSDMPWAEARVGEQRLAGAYAWRRMLEAGVALAFGSDFPVEQPSPLLGLYAAVTRQDLAGLPEGGWLPDQRLSIAEAIAGFSSGAAYAAHRDDHLGVLAPGFRADLTVLRGDPMTVAPSELPKLEIHATMVDGELVYEA
jgi:predicted amidohydrolase YtcJ